jgi:peptidoglycan/LPS O-acetylase OafA/YrhL
MPQPPIDDEAATPFTRLDFLDALRCFAALYVVSYHMVLLPTHHLELPGWLAMYGANGGTGVSLFFVVSAFALSYSLDARSDETTPTRRFFVRRFFRIAPLFYAAMALYWIRDIIAFGTAHPFSTVLINASFLFNLSPVHMLGFVWASWTIGVEMLFYLIFPLIHRSVRNLPAALTLFFASILAAQGWSFFIGTYGVASGYVTAAQVATVQHFGLLNQLPVFICGIVTYRLFFDYFVRMNAAARHRLGLMFIMMFCFLYTALLTGQVHDILWGSQVWQGVCYSLLVLGLGLRPLGLLVNAVTSRLGKISYSLYLGHPTLIVILAPIYYWLYSALPNKSAAYGASLLITIGVLTGGALLTYGYIERPGIARGERWISKWFDPRGPTRLVAGRRPSRAH